MYLFLTGDSSALSNWPYADNPSIAILIVLAEIELFYLLPHQRRWRTWFPEVIHYYADADKTQIEIKRLIKEGEWDTKEFTDMRKKLLEVLQIKHNPIDNEVILEKLKSNEEKLKSNEEKLKSNEEKLKSNDERLKSNDEKLNKLEKLEKLDKLEKLGESYCEKLAKLEELEKSSCEKLERLEKLLEEIVQAK
ncbi:unnamed protein product [Rhizophagus irregularis]|nr:unnamed protein product [Rhizophagus irregularis]